MVRQVSFQVLLLAALLLAAAGNNGTEETPTTLVKVSGATSAEDLVEQGGWIIVVAGATLMLALLLSNILHRYDVSVISESVVVIALGFALGKILPTNGGTFIRWHLTNMNIEDEGFINGAILNLFLLPIIIFEAGWSMRHKDFISQLPYILLFAVFGTIISMLVVASLIMATHSCHGISTWRVAFTYAALISAVDPVATLATYSHLHVDPLLNIIVSGESVVNDAVAIVLFRVLNTGGRDAFNNQSVLEITKTISGQTCLLLFGSVGLGLALAFVYVLIMRLAGMRHSVVYGIMFVFLSSFFTHSFAESVCGMSGIITVLFCSAMMSSFAKEHFTCEGNMLCAFALKQSSHFADMIVFLFVGITGVYCDSKGVVFGFLVIAFCLIGRAAAVLPLAAVTNACKLLVHRKLPAEKRTLLSWRHIFMMWHAGLRGGIALALTLQLGSWVDETEGEGAKDTLRNATVIVILVFLVFFGGTTKILLQCFKIPMGGDSKPMHHHHGSFWQLMHTIRARFLTPVLVGRVKADARFEGNTLRTVMSDIERCASRDELPPIPGRHATGMVSLFGMDDPARLDDIYESSENGDAQEECTSEDSDNSA